jgi:phenylalanyl-tRNA synthetase alpha chain
MSLVLYSSIVSCKIDGERNEKKQKFHTQEAATLLEQDLKNCLLGLTKALFGPDIEYKWVECYFPFTHPSWELEIFYNGKWLEVLGCGIVEQEILFNAGAQDKLGFAFGLGLERLAMILYEIPDIRLFWSKDSGFLTQFVTNDESKKIIYRPVSRCPQCANDISFWLPQNHSDSFSNNDFYDLVRTIGGDLVEQVELVDEFYHPKKQRHSQCYRITYRHMEKTLTQEEANEIHAQIEKAASDNLLVEIR